jgi:hypothetical protein
MEALLMTRRTKVWLAVAVLFTLVNLAGIPFAAVAGEVLHTAAHVVLTVLGAYWVWVLVRQGYARGVPHREGAISAPPLEITNQLANLEQSVDAVAIEVERIGEAQRFMTRLFTEKRTPPATESKASDEPPRKN